MIDAVPAITIPARAPFNFELALAYFQRRAGELVDAVHDGAYWRVLVHGGSLVLIEVRGTGDIDHPGLSLRIRHGGPESLEFAAGAVRRSFGLDDDLDAFQIAVAGDPILHSLLEAWRGLRLIRTQSAFEALIWAVIGQQINLTFAFRLKSALVRTYGASVHVDGCDYWAFPTPEQLAGADTATLAASGLGSRKAATIVNVAQLIAGGALPIERLGESTREEAMQRLVDLPGVGPWTAAYTLLRGLGDFGACPSSDLGLRTAAARHYGLGATATTKEMAELATRWGEWRGYAAFYLWNSLAQRAG